MTHDRRDANEARLVALWTDAGGIWYPQKRETGFDGIAIFRGRTWLVEIKDGAKPPSAQALTDNEKLQRDRIKAHGVKYHIWRSVDDVVAALEAPPL